jgi:hypothetical protein
MNRELEFLLSGLGLDILAEHIHVVLSSQQVHVITIQLLSEVLLLVIIIIIL